MFKRIFTEKNVLCTVFVVTTITLIKLDTDCERIREDIKRIGRVQSEDVYSEFYKDKSQ